MLSRCLLAVALLGGCSEKPPAPVADGGIDGGLDAGLELPGDEPRALTATPGDGTLTFTWELPDGGDTNLYFASAAGVTKATFSTLPGGVAYAAVTSPFTVSGLINGHTYHAVATAVFDGGGETRESRPETTGTPVELGDGGDPLFADQWHLQNTGQKGGTAGEDLDVVAAWPGGRGEGVRLSVVDTGVDLQHADLRQNVATGGSYDYLPPTSRSLTEHGTAVAGIAVARDGNGVGLRGVAPRASLVSFDLLQNDTSMTEYDAMTRGEDVVAVSNNSWGADDQTGIVTLGDPMWTQGVSEGTTMGRGGLGIVYVWAAGNGGNPNNGPLDDSNYDGQANSRFVITAGSVGDDGKHVPTSEPGANVLVCAFSRGRALHGLSTTDVTGADGVNDGSGGDYPDPDYRSTFNGTSGAVPQVAGVVALMLQANPKLSWRDVRRVLATTARQNDLGDPGWETTLAGLHVNPVYGFGVVDAASAVSAAKTFSAGAPSAMFSTVEHPVTSAIPDNDAAGVSSTLTVNGSGVGHLEFVEIEFTSDHARAGDLAVSLDRGNGPQDALSVVHTCIADGSGNEACVAYDHWVFGSVRHLDEPADGSWTLHVVDGRPGVTGSFVSWKLTFWGRP